MDEIQFLQTLLAHRPVGLFRHYGMMGVVSGMEAEGAREASTEAYWAKYNEYYDAAVLEEMERDPLDLESDSSEEEEEPVLTLDDMPSDDEELEATVDEYLPMSLRVQEDRRLGARYEPFKLGVEFEDLIAERVDERRRTGISFGAEYDAKALAGVGESTGTKARGRGDSKRGGDSKRRRR